MPEPGTYWFATQHQNDVSAIEREKKRFDETILKAVADIKSKLTLKAVPVLSGHWAKKRSSACVQLSRCRVRGAQVGTVDEALDYLKELGSSNR